MVRFFDKIDGSYRIKKMLRDLVVFASHNVVADPPFSRLDLITCRNLLIYLAPEAQERATALFHFALREGGHLFLGNAEASGGTTICSTSFQRSAESTGDWDRRGTTS